MPGLRSKGIMMRRLLNQKEQTFLFAVTAFQSLIHRLLLSSVKKIYNLYMGMDFIKN